MISSNVIKPPHYCSKRESDGVSEDPYPPFLEPRECARCLGDQNYELRALLEEARVAIQTVNKFGRSSTSFVKFLMPLVPKILRVVTNSQEIVKIGGVLSFPEGFNYEGFHAATEERWVAEEGSEIMNCTKHNTFFVVIEEPCNQCYYEFGGP